MVVHVLYFAACRERVGAASEQVPHRAGRSVRALVDELCRAHPGLAEVAPRCRVAVDQRFAALDDEVPDGAEVALIPPVAGG